MEANGRLQRSSNIGLWLECLVQAAARDFKPFKGFKAGKRQAWTPEQQRAMEANGRLQRSLWPAFLRVLRLAIGRLEHPNNRGLWRQTAGCNALATKACGRSAGCKQPRGILSLLRVLRLANGRLQRFSNRWLWKQTAGCNALATKACGWSAWCKQPGGILSLLRVLRVANGRLERPNNRGLWKQTAGCNALATKACGRSKQPRGILSLLRVLRLANGRLERPNNRGLWKQTAGCNALATKACGWSAWCKQPRGAKKNKFHTCDGPRRHPCLGEGRGRRISQSNDVYNGSFCP